MKKYKSKFVLTQEQGKAVLNCYILARSLIPVELVGDTLRWEGLQEWDLDTVKKGHEVFKLIREKVGKDLE